MFSITTLTIAGSDCCGGAGIQADIKTMSALGVYAASVITAITVQDTRKVYSVCAVQPQIVAEQIRCVIEDLSPQYAKIGMINDEATITAICDVLDSYPIPHLIVDPIMVSSSGMLLMQKEALETFCNRLLPKSYLLTPNIPEAEILADMSIHSSDDIHKASQRIMNKTHQSILIKGGHLINEKKTDYLFYKSPDKSVKEYTFSREMVHTPNTHGTGCTLSSAITAYLARGKELPEAVRLAKEYTYNAMIEGSDLTIGHGTGPLNHFFAPEKLIKIPE